MKINVSFIKSVLTLYNEMLTNGISLVYLGESNPNIITMFTGMAKNEMDRHSLEKSTQRMVYHAIVELLGNLSRHSAEISDRNNAGNGLFIIGKKGETYYIITSNKVTNAKRITLQETLDEINNASKEELYRLYEKQIKEGEFDEYGNAGLGLIDIARKTGKKLNYLFLPYDDDYTFFILSLDIVPRKD